MRLRFVSTVASTLALAGCSFDRAGTADDIGFGDSTALDTAVADFGNDDQRIPMDDAAPDTSGSDALAGDGAIDTAVDVPVTGLLVVTGTPATAFPVDLTAEGSVAWAHWGLFANDTFTRKSGSGAIANAVNPPATRHDGYPVGFTWSDGDPTAVASATPAGIFRYGNEPFEFNVAATTESRELRVYLNLWNATASVIFTVSDSSAAPATIALPAAGTTPGAGHRPQVVAATYRASSPAARLNVTFAKTSAGGTATLFAATLR